ncbi:putative palmitoyltransferase ZDHHC24 [Taenia crassiceps]|uniref:Palmitoyltransferase n=1 Tax=Taenia crassiceps TaxID=6207 RepID=A0ABR4Q3C0_9CEST
MGRVRNVTAVASSCLLLAIFYVECFVVLPHFLEYRSTSYDCVLCLGSFASINVLYNLIFLVFTDPSLAKLMLVQRAGRDWSYCLRCETVRPPRAHHCSQCDVCVLRFDHHCTYLAQCVGHANMVYFIRLLFHLAFACCLASIFNVPYAFHLIYHNWTLWQWLLCILNPVPFILIGWISVSQFLLCLMTSLCVILGPTMFVLFLYHLRQILRNQTSVEVLISKAQNPTQILYEEHDLRPLSYDRGWRANLEQVMGKRWLLGFLLPCLPVVRSTDGLSFPFSDM